MRKKIWSLALVGIVLIFSNTANAALIDNGSYTTDSRTGLLWLDLTQTTNLSYDYVSSQLSEGGQFEGWSYATGIQIASLFDSAGATGPYPLIGDEYTDAAKTLLSLWGSTLAGVETWFYTGDMFAAGDIWLGEITLSTVTYISINQFHFSETDTASTSVGHALVRTSVVPVPASAWLFGSGIIGLVSFARRKKLNQ